MTQLTEKISVVINCFNGDKYLNKAVESVLSQTYKNWEIIFWDNCSNDESKNIIKSYGDPRIIYYRSEKHTSQYEARRMAVTKCNSEFIAFLDVDDWWDDRKLEEQIKLFKDKSIGFACCNYWIVNQRKKKNKRLAFSQIPSGNVTEQLLKRNFVGMSTLMIRKESYFKLDYGFDPNYEIIGDYDLVLRLSEINMLASIEKPLSYYRWHGENLGFRKFDLNIKELKKWIGKSSKFKKYKNFEYLIDYTNFYNSLINIQNKKRDKACKGLFIIKNPFLKLKLLLLIILPLWLINKLRS